MPKKRGRYGDPEGWVCAECQGLRVCLVLQKRLDNPPEAPYHCLRWWTFYPGAPQKFRRFYKYKGSYWTIPVQVALYLMRRADSSDLFRPGDLPKEALYSRDSRRMPESERKILQGSTICNEAEPEWGDNPTLVVSEAQDKRGIWREVMIVDSSGEFCTFRSTTTLTFADYEFAANAPGIYPPWRIDKAMQEVSPAAMREFLRVLEEISQ